MSLSTLKPVLSALAPQPPAHTDKEQLALTLIRRWGGISKAALSRHIHVSPPTAAAILENLAEENLLNRGALQRGRVGQPSAPFILNPEGALSFGIKIGRRSIETALLDMTGQDIHPGRRSYDWPDPGAVFEMAKSMIENAKAALPSRLQTRIVGLGVATPSEIWRWRDEIEGSGAELEAWRDIDVARTLCDLLGMNTFLVNDATAASAAELCQRVESRETTRQPLDFLYIFVGWFVGGGVVLGGEVHTGRQNNAGAIGSMPLRQADGSTRQLLEAASIRQLEQVLDNPAQNVRKMIENPEDWEWIGPPLEDWIQQTAHNLAYAAAVAASVIDFEAVVIDGSTPKDVRRRLVTATQAAYETMNTDGLSPLRFEEGHVGARARAIGAARLPMLHAFEPDLRVIADADLTEKLRHGPGDEAI